MPGSSTGTAHLPLRESHFAASPEQVWKSLQSDESLSASRPSVSSLTWLSPRPFGVGATRKSGGPDSVHERFFRWDEGSRYSFCLYESQRPALRRFAEDYVIAPDGDGTRFNWTVAIDPGRAAPAVQGVRPGGEGGIRGDGADGKKYCAAR